MTDLEKIHIAFFFLAKGPLPASNSNPLFKRSETFFIRNLCWRKDVENELQEWKESPYERIMLLSK